MQSLVRAFVMLASLVAGVWALVEYGPEETVQPLTRRAIELADLWMGKRHVSDTKRAIDVPSPGGLATTRLVAEPDEPKHNLMTSVAAPPLTTSEDMGEMLAVTNASEDSASPWNDSPQKGGVGGVADPLAPLLALGLRNLKTTPWGRDGRLHRVSGDMPVGSHSAMVRHVEAVCDNLEDAVADVLQQAQAWRQQDQALARLR